MRKCEIHDKWYDGGKFDQCFECTQGDKIEVENLQGEVTEADLPTDEKPLGEEVSEDEIPF